MNFFERQDQAKRKTSLLVFLFVIAMILTFLAIHSVIALFFMGQGPEGPGGPEEALYWRSWCNPGLLFADFAFVILLIGGGSLFKIMQISSLKGEGIAESMGGELIEPDTTNFQEKRILNIVEEMAIASGVHVPPVYIMRDEPDINAFAAGFTPNTAVIGITQGALDYLSRDELQGVIGHEFSHILNGDTGINLRLIGVLFGLNMLVIFGWLLFRNSIYFSSVSSDSEDNKSGAAIALAMLIGGLAFVVIGLIGMLCSNIIRAAISRQREYLADASSVQFTRNPDGLASALKKIGCPNVGSVVSNSRSVEASHMFFGSIFKPGFFSGLFDSHPPLDDRIKTIDPSFDGTYPEQVNKVGLLFDDKQRPAANVSQQKLNEVFGRVLPVSGAEISVPGSAASTAQTVGAAVIAGSAVSGTVPPPPPTGVPIPSQAAIPAGLVSGLSSGKTATTPAQQAQRIATQLVDSVGESNSENLVIANSLLAQIPPELSQYARNSKNVRAVVYSLLLDDSMAIRQKQIQYLSEHETPEVTASLSPAASCVKTLPQSAKVPVLELAFPALRRLTKEEYNAFRANVIELIRSDGKVDIFEFTLQEFLLRELDDQFGLRSRPRPVYKSFANVREPFRKTMSFLAWTGNDDPQEVQHAFNSGMSHFSAVDTLCPKNECTPMQFSKALNELTKAYPVLKRELLSAFYICIADDGKITESEAELIRAIAAALDCPMPGWSQAV